MQGIGLSLFVNTWNMVILRNADNEAVHDASQTQPGTVRRRPTTSSKDCDMTVADSTLQT